MDKYSLIDVAYGALLHDIGKFYQRTYVKSNLTEEELETTKYNKKGNYYSHLHSGYTSRFIKDYLGINNEFERLTSEHHKDELDHFLRVIKEADHTASAVDRQDELYDTEQDNKRGNFITARLHSVLSEVDFGKKSDENKVFPLSTLMKMGSPISDFERKSVIDSADEYAGLFKLFTKEVEDNLYLKNRVDIVSYNYLYNLMNKYLVTIPASTYGKVKPSVSLFDHLKLTSAIASCLYDETCFKEKKFFMLEIDISGIQSFIYQVTEGAGAKTGLAKALRGRSVLVGLITNAVSYAFLNEFGLTTSNILFNTGGGSMIILPYNATVENRVKEVSQKIRKYLFELFQADITFVNAMILLDADELEKFQTDKAIELKGFLGRNKMQKFVDVIDDEFFFKKINENEKCKICGRISKHEQCTICKKVEEISDVYTKNNNFGIIYDFKNEFNENALCNVDLGFVSLYFVGDKEVIKDYQNAWYVDSINEFGYGNEKMISNQVPLNRNSEILNFEKIIELTPEEYGDDKLAILKMDVDNLGGIFAFGLKNTEENRTQRSISKYVTMSRLMEFFFGHEIKEICKEVSLHVNPEINQEVINGTMFYINYAGGDDLVIMGSAYSIVLLALEIYKRFSDFTGNENITISGGINFQNDKKPVRFGIQEAEEALSMSKDGDKNAITLLNTTVSFKEYEVLLEEVFDLCDLLKDGKVSRTMLYNIMSNIRDKNYHEFIYLVPRIQYTLFRNIKDKNVLELMRKQLNKVKHNIDVEQYVLKLKLVMLFTREK